MQRAWDWRQSAASKTALPKGRGLGWLFMRRVLFSVEWVKGIEP